MATPRRTRPFIGCEAAFDTDFGLGGKRVSSRATWLSWFAGTEPDGGVSEPGAELERLRRVVNEHEVAIATLKERLTESSELAARETLRARELATRVDELSALLSEAESACANLEASLCRADLRCAEQESLLSTEAGRVEVASRLANSADERYRDVLERWRATERALVRAQHERTLAKQHQAELQLALSKAAIDRENLHQANLRLQTQLKVAQLDKDDAAEASSRRLIQVEQRLRFAFDELECFGDDTHHLLRLACDGLWSRLAEDVPRALRSVNSNVAQDWLTRRFDGCATTSDVVIVVSDVLSRLRLARLELTEHLPLQVSVVPLGEGRSGANAIVRFAMGLLSVAVKARLGVELDVMGVEERDGRYVASLGVVRPAAEK